MKYLLSLIGIICLFQSNTSLSMYRHQNQENQPIDKKNIPQMLLLKTIADDLRIKEINEIVYLEEIRPRRENPTAIQVFSQLINKNFSLLDFKATLKTLQRNDLVRNINDHLSSSANQTSLGPRDYQDTEAMDACITIEIAENLTKNDVEDICFIWSSVIPTEKKETINGDGSKLFLHLKTENYLTFGFINLVLSHIKREDLRRDLNNYKAVQTSTQSRRGQPSEHNLSVPPPALPSYSNAPRDNVPPPTYDESQAQYGQQANNSNTEGAPYVKCVGFRP